MGLKAKMDSDILAFKPISVKIDKPMNCVTSNAFEIDTNDFLENIELLLEYITKSPKNKGKKKKLSKNKKA